MLTELHQRVLSHDPELASGLTGPGRQLSRTAQPDTLPPEMVEFVGRDEELRLLVQQPGDGPRISVIEGMAGVGKTALAIHAARAAATHYPDGTFYLNFHTHDPGLPSLDAAEALHRLLRMLTAPATRIPDAIGERAALLRAQLSRRRAILILDDAAGPDQIQPLLPASGQSLILITTRRTLSGLPGAHALTLDVLSVPDAITLFRRVAGQGRAHDEDAAAMAVELCGRLPLAIQLAAGQAGARLPAPASRSGRGIGPVPGARPGRGQPAGHVGLRRVLPVAGTRAPAVLPAARDEPVRLDQPAGGGRPGRGHPGRGAAGAGRTA